MVTDDPKTLSLRERVNNYYKVRVTSQDMIMGIGILCDNVYLHRKLGIVSRHRKRVFMLRSKNRRRLILKKAFKNRKG